MTAAQLKVNNEVAALNAYVAETISEEKRVAYYRAAYEAGQAAYIRGEEIDTCPFTVGAWGTLGVRGWADGWRDEFGVQFA
jgi:ribosome modulation factor